MTRDEFDKRAKRQRELGPITNFQKIGRGRYRIGRSMSDDDLVIASKALEPCPFDGGIASFKGWTGEMGNGGRTILVRCSLCNVQLPPCGTERWKQGYGTFFADDDAIAVLTFEWNRRVS